MQRYFAFILIFFMAALPGVGHAHLLHKQEATLRLDGEKGYLAVAVPVTALSDIDDNQDGLLTPYEIAAHQDEITRQFKAGFRVSSPEGAATIEFAWITNPAESVASSDPDAPTSYVIIMAGARFKSPPAFVRIETDLFGSALDDQVLKLRVRRGDDIEHGILSKEASALEFFTDEATP